MRIALVMIEPPLPFGSAPSRWHFVLLKGLVERGHQVVALAACGNAGEIPAAKDYFPAPDYALHCYPHSERGRFRGKWDTLRQPYSYMFSPELRQTLNTELARGGAILHLESLWSGWVGLGHTDRAILNIHSSQEIDGRNWIPASLAEKGRKLAALRAERFLLRRYRNICTVSPRLSRRAQEINPVSTVHTVPLGFDLSLYPFRDGSDGRNAAARDPVVGLIGSFDWQPTYSAAVRLVTRLWPELKRRVPNAKLRLIGRRAQTLLSRFAVLPDVQIFGDVPDIFPYFRDLDLLLYAPSAGSGMKVKVLESFALGVPVVTNSDGVEGIPAIDGRHAGIAETDGELIDRAALLLSDPGRRVSQARAARQLVESHCAPGPALDQLEHAYAGIYARRN